MPRHLIIEEVPDDSGIPGVRKYDVYGGDLTLGEPVQDEFEPIDTGYDFPPADLEIP